MINTLKLLENKKPGKTRRKRKKEEISKNEEEVSSQTMEEYRQAGKKMKRNQPP